MKQTENLLSPLKKVTPLSKYLAMVLFIVMPFIGGWVGYSYAPEKVVEVKKNIEVEKAGVADSVQGQVVLSEVQNESGTSSIQAENISNSVINEKFKRKILPDAFVSNETDAVLSKFFDWLSIPDEGARNAGGYPYMKYYDDNVIIVQIPVSKPCSYVELYDRSIVRNDYSGFGSFGECGFLLEDPFHLVMVTDLGIYTWKIGDSSTKMINGSSLDTKNGESYQQDVGQLGYFPDAIYKNGILTVNIYKAESQFSEKANFLQTKTYIIE